MALPFCEMPAHCWWWWVARTCNRVVQTSICAVDLRADLESDLNPWIQIILMWFPCDLPRARRSLKYFTFCLSHHLAYKILHSFATLVSYAHILGGMEEACAICPYTKEGLTWAHQWVYQQGKHRDKAQEEGRYPLSTSAACSTVSFPTLMPHTGGPNSQSSLMSYSG